MKIDIKKWMADFQTRVIAVFLINLPSTVSDKNWSWRFVKEDFDEKTKEFLRDCAKERAV